MWKRHPTEVLVRCGCLVLVVVHVSSAAETGVDFATQIQPILRQKCLKCHGPEQREGGLLLTGRQHTLLPNDSGKLGIVPYEPEASELFRRIGSTDPDEQMPPEDRLSDDQISLIRRWIKAGAPWPQESRPTHWSYVAPRRSPLPRVKQNQWPRNPIDYFVLAKLESEGLEPSPAASPERLVRRVYLDLIGLPPPLDVVDRFVAKPSDLAYLEIVDRLLNSNAYGEKWASHWLDLARYSDSNGYQADQLRDLWAYRDWVIDAMNRDLPFDQFTIEQLAGDLLANAQQSQRVATGFHRATTCNVEAGVDPEANRTDQVIDRVNTTATVWLGTTLECAQCHNHKYDPFSQQDYYQLFAFFNNTPLEVRQAGNADGVQFDFWGPKLELVQSPDDASERQALLAELDHLGEELKRQRTASLAEMTEWEEGLTATQRAEFSNKLRRALRQDATLRSAANQTALQELFWKSRPELRQLQQRVDDLAARENSLRPPTTLVMVEMDAPRPASILLRGQFLNQGRSVTAATPATLHPFPDQAPKNRLGLAQWLVSRDNPLVARVTVNRWWQEFFGRGLVTTPEDFGTQADPPTHPLLLDWLACELMDRGWSMKAIHRTVVSSSTYRQTSRVSSRLAQYDPNNQLYGRGARFRLRAETIRDNALAISGLLSRYMRGGPVYPPQPDGLWRQTGRNEPVFVTDRDERRYRRGVYVVWRRAAPYPSFVNFDAPDRMSCIVSRPTTNTPLQALTLLNDETYVEMAKGLAWRMITEASKSTHDRLSYAFRLCVTRMPNPAESATLDQLYRDELARLANESQAVEQLARGFERIAALSEQERLEWAALVCVANALLNLDETITRG